MLLRSSSCGSNFPAKIQFANAAQRCNSSCSCRSHQQRAPTVQRVEREEAKNQAIRREKTRREPSAYHSASHRTAADAVGTIYVRKLLDARHGIGRYCLFSSQAAAHFRRRPTTGTSGHTNVAPHIQRKKTNDVFFRFFCFSFITTTVKHTPDMRHFLHFEFLRSGDPYLPVFERTTGTPIILAYGKRSN